MRRSLLVCMFLMVQGGFAFADELETVTIPLDQIWGYSRPLRDLEPELFIHRDTPQKWEKYSTPEAIEEIKRKAEQSLTLPIERAMQSMPRGKEARPGNGFAVQGTGREALQGAYSTLVEGDEPTECFPAGTNVTIVFFARPAQPRIRLNRVEIKNRKVGIHYMLISHGQANVMWHLMFIPCGKLSPGVYHVEMFRSSEKEGDFNQQGFPPVQPGIEERIICQPFSFVVTEHR